MIIDFVNITADRKLNVIYTKSRREKKVAQFCESMGITYYLPLETRDHIYGRKKVTTQVPLFPGYLFCCCNNKDRYNLLRSHQIARILDVIYQQKLLNDLQKIYLAQFAEMDLRPCQHLQKGRKVRILSGPLSGYEGILKRNKNKKRLILNVEFINCAASIEVDQKNIEPV